MTAESSDTLKNFVISFLEMFGFKMPSYYGPNGAWRSHKNINKLSKMGPNGIQIEQFDNVMRHDEAQEVMREEILVTK